MPEPIVYDISAPGIEAMIRSLEATAASSAKAEASINEVADAAKAMSEAQKQVAVEQTKGAAATEKAAIAAQKAAQKAEAAAQRRAEKEKAAADAMLEMADRAELTASRVGKEGTRAYETLLKVGGEYGQMLREGIAETSELAKTWRAGLSPAERTALNIAKVSAATDDAKTQTLSWSLAIGNATDKLADQIRRQDTNVGSQNKLSRSLSELLEQQTQAILKGQQMIGGLSLQSIQQLKTADSVDDLTLALRKLEFDTNDADKGSEHYKNTVAALQARIKGLSIEEALAAREAEKTSEAYGKQKQRLDALETAMDAASIPGAGLVTRFKQMSDSLETVNEHGSRGQAALLKVGIAVGSVGAAASAAVAGVAAIGAAIVATTAQAADWNAELKDVGLAIDQAPLERYAASISSVGNVVKAMGVQVASTFGPAIEAAATRIAALGLAGIDAFKNLSKGEDVMTRLARVSATVLVEAFTLPITALQRMTSAMAEPFRLLENIPGTIGVTAKALGVMGTAATAVSGSLDAWKTEQVDAVTASLSMLGREAMSPLIAVSNDYMAAAEKLVTKQTAVNAAARDGAVAAKAQAAAIQETTIAARDAILTIGNEAVPSAFREAQQAVSGISDEMIQKSKDTAEAIGRNHREAAERARASWTGSFSSIGESAGKLSELIVGYSEKQGDAAHKAAIIAFRVQQGAAVVGVAISTSQAIMQALGSMPPPASYVAAGAALLAGVTQGAAILSQPPPSPSGATSASMPSAPSAPSMSVGSANTGRGVTAIKAEQMAEMGTSKVDTSGLTAQSPVQVTDAYIAPSSSSMMVRTTPGDAVSIERGGARADRDGAMLGLLRELIDETRTQGRLLADMISQVQMARHRRETAVGGVY